MNLAQNIITNIKLNDIYVYYYIKIINKIKVFLKKVI